MTPWTVACQASQSITNSQSLLKLISIESVIPSNHLILCHPLLTPSIFPSIRVFSNESVLCFRWPKYWNFSFGISPSNEYSGLISFRMDRLDLLAVQGNLKSLLQHHSSKASILWCSTQFIVQLSQLSSSLRLLEKTLALTRWTFVGEVTSLLFNTLSMLAITFLPRSKSLLVSWLQSPSALSLEPRKIKSASFHCFPICLPWSDATGCYDLSFLNVELKPTFSLSSFTFIKRVFSSSLLSTTRAVSSVYLMLLIFLPAILIPVCVSSSPAFLIIFFYRTSKKKEVTLKICADNDNKNHWGHI